MNGNILIPSDSPKSDIRYPAGLVNCRLTLLSLESLDIRSFANPLKACNSPRFVGNMLRFDQHNVKSILEGHIKNPVLCR